MDRETGDSESQLSTDRETIEGGTMYVDPHPSITDRIKAELELGEMDDDAYPIPSDQIVRITDDEVELTMEELPDEAE